MHTETPSSAADGAWRVRPFRAGDEEAIVALLNRRAAPPFSVEHYRWKLLEGPGARAHPQIENVWLGVDARERPVCHYAGIPSRWRAPDVEGLVMVAVDALTAPEWRRRGVLTAVASAAHDHWRAAGIPLVLGLPNEQWRSRAGALGWEPLFDLRWLIRPLRPGALLARRLGIRALGPGASWLDAPWNAVWRARTAPGVAVSEITEPPIDATLEKRLANAWSACRALEVAAIERDGGWLPWRFLAGPQRRYRLLLAERGDASVGWAAFRIEERDGRRFAFLAEVIAPPSDDAAWQSLLQGVLERLLEERVDALATLAIAGSAPYRRLRRRGFRFSWGAFGFHGVFLDRAPQLEALRTAARWLLTGSEFDVL